ncbi:hypothetical protein N9L18_00905 [Candidatus Pacebacteria bacterium]|nr:hypothetical protein [Candidatus Paceibacterota bacterium]
MNNIETFKTDGFVDIEYSQPLRDAVLRMEESWRTFCSLPEEAKMTFPYSKESAGVGYELKQEKGKSLDLKENFNFTIGRYGWLMNSARKSGLLEAIDLVNRCRDVALELQPEVESFAEEVEQKLGVDGFAKETVRSVDTYYVRLIHYFGDREVGEETATSHTDKSGFTFHLYENTPGLQRLTYDGEWVDMAVSDGRTQIIPNMQLQYRTKGDLKATCHRVIATEKSAKEGRYAAVCFVMLKDTPKYDKEAAGRLQEREPGFNYTESHKSFSRLFKK